MPKINKNLALIIGLVIVIIAGYFTFTRTPSVDTELSTIEGQAADSAVGQELVIELNRLKALRNINTSIFADPIFSSLIDFTQKVEAQPLGRVNPFAPIGSDI